ncbi:hypothetical protein GOODEAATRI_002310 [Goodea atripinnis]|uniref:Uncharacterized protein n=1 Tax=Goodea atripinnis TaxID=208336 RepID=A0ABV0NGW9_9TELE
MPIDNLLLMCGSLAFMLGSLRNAGSWADRASRRLCYLYFCLGWLLCFALMPEYVVLDVDELVFCAGQIALVPCTMCLVKAGTSVQAQLSFSHVKKVLEAVIHNLTLAHVVQAHCYTTRHQDIATIRAVWESMLRGPEEKKVSRCQVKVLII